MRTTKIFTFLSLICLALFGAQVRISEIYFDSNFNEGADELYSHYGEFIELYNRSGLPVDVSGWILIDNVSSFVIPQGKIIAGKDYLIIASGSSSGLYPNNFPNLFPEALGKESKILYQQNIELNNRNDLVILKNNTGKQVDEIRYTTTDVCKYRTPTSYCYKSKIFNNYGGTYNTPIVKDYTYSLQRQNFDNGNLIVEAKATPFNLIVADTYTGGTGSGTGTGTGGAGITSNSFNDDNYIYSRSYLEAVTTENPSAKQIQAIQYFDGLGRPKQIIAIKATPKGNDLVTPIEYDGFGRQTKDWLPLPQQSTGNGAINSSPSTSFYSGFVGANLYSEKKLEMSPLDRLQEQGHPGTDWKVGSTHSIKFDYDANNDNEVKKYAAFSTTAGDMIASSLGTPTYYGASQLYKNKVTDEDGNESYEFKNGQGQTLLVKKVLSSTESADTYYVYNEYDQLSFVIPPLAAVKGILTQTDLDQLCYQYRYDFQNRLVEKKLPGKGWEYMVYDMQDRLIMTQDANLKTQGRWLFTKYDQFGRVAYTGIAMGGTRVSEQANANTAGKNYVERKTAIAFTQNTLGVYYGNPTSTTSYPTGMATLLSVNYYDEYPVEVPYLPTSIESQTVNAKTPQASPTNSNTGISTKGLPLASYVKNIEDDKWTKSYTYYDLKARPIGTYSVNHLGGFTKTETRLKFSGKPEYTITYHKKADRDNLATIKETFEYDNQERPTRHWHQVNNTGLNELLAENLYNELGQLEEKKVGGSTGVPLQKIKYAYNIRGWVLGINSPDNLGASLFGYRIKYNNVDGLQVPNLDYPNDKVLPKYNGNIAEVDWKTASQPNDVKRRYGYVYDGLNRLVAGYYQNPSNASGKEYFERLQYDVNGNISTLKRSANTNGNVANLIDNLAYTYTGNQLQTVADGSQNSSGYPYLSVPNTYTYDANGNMLSQKDKGITKIDYNYLNLPNKITEGTKITQYFYKADGVKLYKTKLGGNTSYLDGFQYENDIIQFVPTAEGYFDFTKNLYIYNCVDHLGNVRLSYYRDPSTAVLKVLEESNYYPFGMKHSGYNQFAGNSAYNYKYNGKELQETGMYDYGARFYMPDIGRFGTIDPRSQYTHEAYSYVWNNPIYFNDPTGMTGEAFADCPTCPKTPTYQPFIDDKKNTYVYDPATGKVEKEIQIQEVVVTGKAKSSNSGPGGLAMMALMVSQVDSPAPGPADVVSAFMLLGAGVWWTVNQFTPPSTGYTTIADPGIGMRNLNSESATEEETDVNGITVPDENKIPRDSLNPPTKPGNAPTFKKDGKSVEIHHEDQNAKGPFKEMHPNDHRGKGNYNKNHPQGNKPLTKQERIRFNNDRQKYWRKEYPNVK